MVFYDLRKVVQFIRIWARSRVETESVSVKSTSYSSLMLTYLKELSSKFASCSARTVSCNTVERDEWTVMTSLAQEPVLSTESQEQSLAQEPVQSIESQEQQHELCLSPTQHMLTYSLTE